MGFPKHGNSKNEIRDTDENYWRWEEKIKYGKKHRGTKKKSSVYLTVARAYMLLSPAEERYSPNHAVGELPNEPNLHL